MLASASLGHDLLFAHLTAQQGLAQSVVDLVRACVVEVLPLQVDPRLPSIRPAPHNSMRFTILFANSGLALTMLYAWASVPQVGGADVVPWHDFKSRGF